MGQYFVSVLSRSQAAEDFVAGVYGHISPWETGNGAKLMEHAYVGNLVTEQAMAAISVIPARVVWAGDYADPEPGSGPNPDTELTLYSLIDGAGVLTPKPVGGLRYLLNFDRQQYVDLERVAPMRRYPDLKIHPLPLMTVEGNGRGGGDFRGTNPYLGVWARELLFAAPAAWEPGTEWEQVHVDFDEA